MSWAPGAICPNGGRRSTSSVAPDAKQVGEVGGAVGELQHLDRAARVRERLGQSRAQPRLERGPVERLSRADRSDLGGRVGDGSCRDGRALRGRGAPGAGGQAAPPWMPSTAPVVKLDALRGEVERGPDDLLGLAAAAERHRLLGARLEGFEVPRLRDVGEEGTRHDAVHPHRGAEGAREALGERVHRRLGRRVGDDAGGGPHRGGARHHDDRAARARGHPRAHHRGETERALQVHVEDLVPQVLGDVLDAVVERGHPRVVDQHVDPPELGVRALGEGLDLAPVADVAGHREGAAAGRLADLLGGRLAGGELAAGDDHVGARLREGQDHGAPEAAAAAGDQRDLAAQVEEAAQHSSRSASSTKSPTTTSNGCAVSGSSAPRPGPCSSGRGT